MAVVRGDPAELWALYSAISDLNQDIDAECQTTLRALEILKERLYEKKNQIAKKIAALEGELSQIKNKKRQAEEEGNSVSAMEAAEAEITAQIAALEAQLDDMKQLSEKAGSYRSKIEAGKKQCAVKLRKGGRKVNRYSQFLESLLFEQDYAAYQESSGGAIAGDSKGRFRKMEFRGTMFYCDDGAFDLNKEDGSGRTNLQRMEKGLAPVGFDGLPVNLHHTQQSESGPIMELSQTVHKTNHAALHVNTNNIPSGINRSTFNVLKSAYWKRRAAFMAREMGK